MRELFKDKEHLVRVAALFIVGLAAFLLVRAALVPKDFGEFGHYRSGALKDNMEKPLAYAGRATCEGPCHEDAVNARMGSKHGGIGCETCHGPQAKHANSDDPGKARPGRPDPRTICLSCHAENVAKPARFPQVNPRDHGDGQPCTSCHKPHHPEISAEPAPAPKASGSEANP